MNRTQMLQTLPRKDWVLLPLIAVVTTLALLLAAEVIARIGWPEDTKSSCLPKLGRPPANCTARIKAFEGVWHEESFNECGYRGTGPCNETPAGGRIAVLGSSTSWGYLIPFDQTWSVQAARQIGARCGIPPDIQSLGGFMSLNEVAQRLPEVVALRPQLAVLVIAPFDLLEMPKGGFDVHSNAPRQPKENGGLLTRLNGLIMSSRALGLAQHLLYRDPNFYTKAYLRFGDKADFLRPPFSSAWLARLAYVDTGIGYIADQLRVANVPLMLVYAPQQAQADIVAAAMRFPGVDPLALDTALADIAARHGAAFVDGARAFERIGNAWSYFLPVNGHLNENGHNLLGRAVASSIIASPATGLCGSATLTSGRASQERP
jgi:hypothetical protein